MSEDYQPVSCQLHSEIELYIMHRSRVMITLLDQSITGMIKDITTRNKAEYILLVDQDNHTHEIRLDRISLISEIA